MKTRRIFLGALALAVAAAAVVGCKKENEKQSEAPAAVQQADEPHDYTLAEMIEAMTEEEGKAFFENQPIKDYTYACESVLNDCDGAAKSEEDASFVISWRWPSQDGGCNSVYAGICKVIKKKRIPPKRMQWGISNKVNLSSYPLPRKTDLPPTDTLPLVCRLNRRMIALSYEKGFILFILMKNKAVTQPWLSILS